jgi:hypothetical protein
VLDAEFEELNSRSVLDDAGGSSVAAEVSVVFHVEFDPEVPEGAASRFWAKPPSLRYDSAARESEATGPVPS